MTDPRANTTNQTGSSVAIFRFPVDNHCWNCGYGLMEPWRYCPNCGLWLIDAKPIEVVRNIHSGEIAALIDYRGAA